MSPPVSTGETGPKNDWPTAVHVSAAKLGTVHPGCSASAPRTSTVARNSGNASGRTVTSCSPTPATVSASSETPKALSSESKRSVAARPPTAPGARGARLGAAPEHVPRSGLPRAGERAQPGLLLVRVLTLRARRLESPERDDDDERREEREQR